MYEENWYVYRPSAIESFLGDVTVIFLMTCFAFFLSGSKSEAALNRKNRYDIIEMW